MRIIGCVGSRSCDACPRPPFVLVLAVRRKEVVGSLGECTGEHTERHGLRRGRIPAHWLCSRRSCWTSSASGLVDAGVRSNSHLPRLALTGSCPDWDSHIVIPRSHLGHRGSYAGQAAARSAIQASTSVPLAPRLRYGHPVEHAAADCSVCTSSSRLRVLELTMVALQYSSSATRRPSPSLLPARRRPHARPPSPRLVGQTVWEDALAFNGSVAEVGGGEACGRRSSRKSDERRDRDRLRSAQAER